MTGSLFHLILIVLALVLFFLAGLGLPFAGAAPNTWYGRWNLIAWGLFCLTLSLLVK